MKMIQLLSLCIMAAACQSLFGQSSVVDVLTDKGTGQGVVIARAEAAHGGWMGTVVTANHVISDSESIRVAYSNGRKSKNCRVVATDEKADVALVAVWMPHDTELAMIADRPVAPGESLSIQGRQSCGSAVAARPTSSDRIFADAVVVSGDSGGPVFNMNGQLVGVISGGWFWFEGQKTWPTRACNVGPIRRLLGK